MKILNLDKHACKPIFVKQRLNSLLQVLEQDNYRWLQSDDAIQSLMDITQPNQVILSVHQAMLIFILWLNKPVKLLNLGMGMGIFERALLAPDNAGIIQQLTSVEQDAFFITLAQKFFSLPGKTCIKQQSAQVAIEESDVIYDVILCDIFIKAQVANCLYDLSFFQHCCATLHSGGVMIINVMVDNEQQLIKMLTLAHQVFQFSALITFSNYKNIVVLVSQQTLPDTAQLLAANNVQDNRLSIDFSEHINQWRLIR